MSSIDENNVNFDGNLFLAKCVLILNSMARTDRKKVYGIDFAPTSYSLAKRS